MKKLLIWGTGKLTRQFIDSGYHGEIVGFIETNKMLDTFMHKPVYNACDIPDKVCDYIVVSNSYSTEIYNLCIKLGIDLSKVIFLYGIKNRFGCIDLDIIKDILLEKIIQIIVLSLNYMKIHLLNLMLKDTIV